MHIYVFPKTSGRKDLCDDIHSHLIINTFKEVQIDFCQMKDNTCLFGSFGVEALIQGY